MNQTFYFETLYPFQERVLQTLNELETGFYLSGGTAASRGYLDHHFSDDLDLFVNLGASALDQSADSGAICGRPVVVGRGACSGVVIFNWVEELQTMALGINLCKGR